MSTNRTDEVGGPTGLARRCLHTAVAAFGEHRFLAVLPLLLKGQCVPPLGG